MLPLRIGNNGYVVGYDFFLMYKGFHYIKGKTNKTKWAFLPRISQLQTEHYKIAIACEMFPLKLIVTTEWVTHN